MKIMPIQSMRPFKVATLLLILCLSFFSGRAFPQRYVAKIKYTDTAAATISPITTHLQATISQPEKGEMKFLISISNPATKSVVISFVKGNDEFFSQVIKANEYANTYNMSQVDDGEYTIVISNGKEKIRKRISISTVTAVNRQVEIK
jgi:hypothetical protein